MSNLRKLNGRANPWKVKYWGLGKESWVCSGNIKADYYANIYQQFDTFMPNPGENNILYRIASGANDDDYNWTDVIMKEVPQEHD